MSPDQFRTLGHRMVDWVADYMERVESVPVASRARPGDLLAALPKSAPTRPGGTAEWDRIFGDLDELILPGLTHWQHPGFFAYFPCNSSGPGVLGEIASAGLNVNGMLWATSPAATELETRVLDWCADLYGLPGWAVGQGVIQGTASEATLIALLAAKQRLRAPADPPGRSFAVYCSEHAHSSVVKAAMIAGIATGPDDHTHVRQIVAGPDGRMDADALAAAIRADADDVGRPDPCAVVATIGTTGTGAIDPVAEVAGITAGTGLWLHIDAAWAGPAAACPEHRAILDGVDRADSLCLNPHKWGLTNFDCDLFYTRDRDALTRALSITPEYLRNEATDAGDVVDYRDWQIPLGRRFRALKLWFVLRHYGAEGLRAHIRQHVAWAEWLEAKLAGDPRFGLSAPRSLSLVCFHHRDGDDATAALMRALNDTGEVFLSHTRVPEFGPAGDRLEGPGRYVIRVAIGATATERRHVEHLWTLIDRHAG